jgi:hypothetical protein
MAFDLLYWDRGDLTARPFVVAARPVDVYGRLVLQELQTELRRQRP